MLNNPPWVRILGQKRRQFSVFSFRRWVGRGYYAGYNPPAIDFLRSKFDHFYQNTHFCNVLSPNTLVNFSHR